MMGAVRFCGRASFFDRCILPPWSFQTLYPVFPADLFLGSGSGSGAPAGLSKTFRHIFRFFRCSGSCGSGSCSSAFCGSAFAVLLLQFCFCSSFGFCFLFFCSISRLTAFRHPATAYKGRKRKTVRAPESGIRCVGKRQAGLPPAPRSLRGCNDSTGAASPVRFSWR